MKKLSMFVLGCAAVLCAGSLAQAADDMGGEKKFTVHGEVRFRGEFFTNMTDFTDTDSYSNGSFDDTHDIYPWRTRIGVKGDLGNDIWVYAEVQGSGVAGDVSQERDYFGEPQFFNGSDVDLYQGWVKWKDVGTSTLDLTFGRQEIVFDRGLHFSSLDFYNGVSHDAVMAAWDYENFGIHGFWSKNYDDEDEIESSTSHDDHDLLGVHFKHMVGKDKDQDVAYYLFYQLGRDFNSPGNMEVYTLGGRWGKEVEGKEGLFWNAELAIQTGDANSDSNCTVGCDQSGMIFEGSIGWAFAEAKHKIWFGALMASGDDDPNDDESATYQPIYTDFHNRLGYADLFDASNITALNLGWNWAINDVHGLGVTFYQFTKTEDEDFVYASPVADNAYVGGPSTGICISSSTVSCEDDLGSEIDLIYSYKPMGNLGFDVAWSIFTPGDVFEEVLDMGLPTEETIGDDTAWRLTAQARARW